MKTSESNEALVTSNDNQSIAKEVKSSSKSTNKKKKTTKEKIHSSVEKNKEDKENTIKEKKSKAKASKKEANDSLSSEVIDTKDTVETKTSKDCKKKEKKPKKPLNKVQKFFKSNWFMWPMICVLGLVTGGLLGLFITGNGKGDSFKESDYFETSDNVKKRDSEYATWLTDTTQDISKKLNEVQVFQLSCTKLLSTNFMCESAGYCNAGKLGGIQSITGSRGVIDGETYFESVGYSGLAQSGNRFFGDANSVQEFTYKSITSIKDGVIDPDGGDNIPMAYCTYPDKPKATYTNAEYATKFGDDIHNPCIYLVTSKTIDTTKAHSIKYDSTNKQYTLTFSLTKYCSYRYNIQMRATSSMLKSVSYDYADFVAVLDSELKPVKVNVYEEYTTNTKFPGINPACSAKITQRYYYEDIAFPERTEPYRLRIDNTNTAE